MTLTEFFDRYNRNGSTLEKFETGHARIVAATKVPSAPVERTREMINAW